MWWTCFCEKWRAEEESSTTISLLLLLRRSSSGICLLTLADFLRSPKAHLVAPYPLEVVLRNVPQLLKALRERMLMYLWYLSSRNALTLQDWARRAPDEFVEPLLIPSTLGNQLLLVVARLFHLLHGLFAVFYLHLPLHGFLPDRRGRGTAEGGTEGSTGVSASTLCGNGSWHARHTVRFTIPLVTRSMGTAFGLHTKSSNVQRPFSFSSRIVSEMLASVSQTL
uniref:Uncharacterized protein TCIL3000_1_70 n=1 Tax=Trypanosoma congolense (strain IL3000) TaxID=1068625 RepID=G0UIP9_TRYCI|nr:unnamed protein product [Trypanosoma congolense IL3000]